MESRDETVNAKLVLSLLRRVLDGPFWFELNANPAVEMTLLHQAENHRLLVGLLNMEQLVPPIPTTATVRVQLPSGRRATRVVSLPQRKAIPFETVGPHIQFHIEPYDVVAMSSVEYQ
jgi:hypothetical protein